MNMSYYGNMNIPGTRGMDKDEQEEMNIYANADASDDVRTETDNTDTKRHQTLQHTDSLKCHTWVIKIKTVMRDKKFWPYNSNGEFVLRNVTRNDSGDYICLPEWDSLVRNQQGLNATMELTVNFLDGIKCNTSSPLNISVGEDVAISCIAKASQHLQYKWMRGDTTLSLSDTLSLTSVTSDHSGTYKLTAVLLDSQFQTDVEFSIRVLSKQSEGTYGVLIQYNASAAAVEGQNVSLQCIMGEVNDIKIIQLEWIKEQKGNQKNDQNIVVFHPGFPTYYFQSGPFLETVTSPKTGKLQGSILTLYKVTMNDSGNYICEIISYPNGSIRRTTKLQVTKPPPSVKMSYPHGFIKEGGDVKITCSASPPPLRYELGRSKDKIFWLESSNGEFILPHVTRNDSDVYICLPEWDRNQQGFNATMELTVNFLDGIKCNTSSTLNISVGEDVAISCIAKASQHLEYKWMRGDTTLSLSDTLSLTSVTSDHSGTYKLTAVLLDNQLQTDVEFSIHVLLKQSKANENIFEYGDEPLRQDSLRSYRFEDDEMERQENPIYGNICLDGGEPFEMSPEVCYEEMSHASTAKKRLKLRDFLMVYNRMTEICFQRCTSNFNYRNLTMDEERCADSCAGKLIRTNHRLMGTYVQLMPAMVQKRMQEMESKAAEVAKAEAAAQGGAPALENLSTAITTTTPMPESPQIPSAPADISTSLATNVSGFGQTQSLSDVPTVPNNTQTFTNESLEGLAASSPVISTSSSVPKVDGGPVLSAVEKLNLKPSSVMTTSGLETRSEGGAGQSPQNPS
ncbi:mitochondrial import inner membrane translocase subunit Tim10 B-like protein [Labeo rohita]|uniref:Mitochondrial import inner membrane translocase subunit Tim10 B-like protein n=1 Tax=Labeo rohita TaxID=84645 RepID=A0A498LJK8_LABRO|nr:mitochondrial import inner membrane translocase subunit Tim10 B-like protein [Labeo rohita]